MSDPTPGELAIGEILRGRLDWTSATQGPMGVTVECPSLVGRDACMKRVSLHGWRVFPIDAATFLAQRDLPPNRHPDSIEGWLRG